MRLLRVIQSLFNLFYEKMLHSRKAKKYIQAKKKKTNKKNSLRIKISKRKKVTSLKLPLITSFTILLQNEELKYSCHTSSRLREEIILN